MPRLVCGPLGVGLGAWDAASPMGSRPARLEEAASGFGVACFSRFTGSLGAELAARARDTTAARHEEAGREHTSEAQQRVAGRWNDRRDAGEEGDGLEDEVRGAVAARLAEEVGDAAIGQAREALEAERGPRAVSQEALEPVAIAGPHGDAGMDVEAEGLGCPRALGPGGEARGVHGHGSAVRGEAQERAAEERHLHAGFERRWLGGLVGALLGRPVLDEAAAAQPPDHARLDARRDGPDVLARRRGALVEGDGACGVAAEDAVGDDDVIVHKAPEATRSVPRAENVSPSRLVADRAEVVGRRRRAWGNVFH